jgi:hypothetical protein
MNLIQYDIDYFMSKDLGECQNKELKYKFGLIVKDHKCFTGDYMVKKNLIQLQKEGIIDQDFNKILNSNLNKLTTKNYDTIKLKIIENSYFVEPNYLALSIMQYSMSQIAYSNIFISLLPHLYRRREDGKDDHAYKRKQLIRKCMSEINKFKHSKWYHIEDTMAKTEDNHIELIDEIENIDKESKLSDDDDSDETNKIDDGSGIISRQNSFARNDSKGSGNLQRTSTSTSVASVASSATTYDYDLFCKHLHNKKYTLYRINTYADILLKFNLRREFHIFCKYYVCLHKMMIANEDEITEGSFDVYLEGLKHLIGLNKGYFMKNHEQQRLANLNEAILDLCKKKKLTMKIKFQMMDVLDLLK